MRLWKINNENNRTYNLNNFSSLYEISFLLFVAYKVSSNRLQIIVLYDSNQLNFFSTQLNCLSYKPWILQSIELNYNELSVWLRKSSNLCWLSQST